MWIFMRFLLGMFLDVIFVLFRVVLNYIGFEVYYVMRIIWFYIKNLLDRIGFYMRF